MPVPMWKLWLQPAVLFRKPRDHHFPQGRRVADPEGRPFVRMVAGHGLYRGFLCTVSLCV